MVSIPGIKLDSVQQLFNLQKFYLPKISCSLPTKTHPDHVSLCNEADKWILNHLKLNDPEKEKMFVQWKIPLFTCMMIPEGPKDKLLPACKFSWMATAVDDLWDDGKTGAESTAAKQKVESFISLCSSGSPFPEDTPVSRICGDLVPELRAKMHPATYERLLASLHSWNRTLGHWQGDHELHMLDVDAYVKYRLDNISYAPWLQLTEMCLGIALKDKHYASSDLKRAEEALIHHVWMINDLFSFGKEFQKKQLKNFLVVLVLTHPEIHTFQDAVDHVCDLLREKEREYFYYHNILKKEAMAAGDHELLQYLELIQYMMSSNVLYHCLTARYFGVDSSCINGEQLHGTWVLDPHKIIFVPAGTSHP